ncbi:diguanylate cyclase [Caloramator sp. mosi_1]|uniref:GGDEF domain-containing protein n=1 Tax=Caloramator sp. mosi_1 TaxID=3023090 RepID=UPI002362440E|nr:diguanylate cyclase [Caloramator sp. mosi_1]WDC84863.1 diguanylate cyclase [Caloramator sp. mosi_1]
MEDTITSYIKSSLKTRNLEVYFAWMYSILLLIFVISFIKLNSNLNLNIENIGIYIVIFSLMVLRMFANIKTITNNVKWFEYENIFDKLTQFYKREKLPDILNKIKMFKHRVYPISLILIDIDEMQAYNSKYGIQEGDNRIRTISLIIDRFLGQDSICIRYGGDEFLIIFLNKQEKEIKDRICKLTRYVAEQNKILKEKIGFTFYNLTLNEHTNLEKALYNVEIKLSQKRLSKNIW